MSVKEWLRAESLADLIFDGRHSVDFRTLRAEYISLRVRLLSFLFAALAPLWIPIDYCYLDPRLFSTMVSLRLAFSILYLGLAWWCTRPARGAVARLRLLAFLIIPGLFYVGSRLLLADGQVYEEVLVGYAFLPFLMVALLAVFPLTLTEGVAAAATVISFVAGYELYAGTLFEITALANFWLLALLAAIALWAELTQLHMLLRLYREATRDPLTRLVNRRVLSRWLDDEIVRAATSQRPLSVLLFDLDLFKRINDTHGHLVGDVVLRAFGELLNREVAPGLVGRYGGEEFLAILPGVAAQEALAMGERIRAGCHALTVPAGEGRVINFTTSIGVAQWAPGESAEALVSRVDKGLYQAKESGRDLVTLAE